MRASARMPWVAIIKMYTNHGSSVKQHGINSDSNDVDGRREEENFVVEFLQCVRVLLACVRVCVSTSIYICRQHAWFSYRALTKQRAARFIRRTIHRYMQTYIVRGRITAQRATPIRFEKKKPIHAQTLASRTTNISRKFVILCVVGLEHVSVFFVAS